MFKRFLAYLVPVVILGLIVYLFSAGHVLKQPRGETDLVEQYILLNLSDKGILPVYMEYFYR